MSAQIYLHWGGVGALATLDLPESSVGVADFQIDPHTGAATARRYTGAVHVSVGAKFDRVTLVVSNVGAEEEDARADLDALREHLREGLSIGVALDGGKAWAAFGVLAGSYPGLVHPGNYWGVYSGGLAALAAGDRVVIRSLGDGGWREEHGIHTVHTSGNLQFTKAVRFDHGAAGGPIYVRHRLFYPVLRHEEGQHDQPLLTEDQGRTWSFQARLYEDVDALQTLSEIEVLGDNGLTLDQQIDRGGLDDGVIGNQSKRGDWLT